MVTCQVLQQMGFGLTHETVTMVVQDYLRDHPERERQFGSSGPGFDWWQCFLQRWPDLTSRKPQHLSVQRARAGTRENLDEWYDKVKDFFEKVKLTRRGRPCSDFAHRVWNCDETGFCLGVTAKTVLIEKAREAGVDLFTLPSNTSHLLQPLDVAVYA